MDSPPKRMTRARAAAKATEATVKTTKIVTAAARAKSTATGSTSSTAAKRKTRADEQDEDEAQQEVPVARKPRGRPKKIEEPEIEAPARAIRGRAAKKPATEASKVESAPVKATRGRPKKIVAEPETDEEPAPQLKKTTRTRAAATTRAAASKPAVKKSVKFQEPDKENMEPTTRAKEPATTGLRGRPARRGAAGVRGTRAAGRTSATAKKPLSPKKVTQMPVSKSDSEDELAGDMPPVRQMMRSPVKLGSSISHNKQQSIDSEEDSDSTTVAEGILKPPHFGISIALGTPARRFLSPVKDTMQSPAKRIGAIAFPGSALKPKESGQDDQTSPFKASLLQSAAKRPKSPIKGLNFGSTLKSQHSQSAMKSSFLHSPAKRAFPGMVPLTEPRQRNMAALTGSPAMKPLVLATPKLADSARPSEKLIMEDEEEEMAEGCEDDPFSEPIESLRFPGRLSAVLPRHADPALETDMEEAMEEEAPLEVDALDSVEEADEEPAEQEEVAEPMSEIKGMENMEAMEDIIDEVAAEMETTVEELEATSTTPVRSPEHSSNPMFQLRVKDLDPCHDIDSDSEDELSGPLNNVPTTPTPYHHKTPKTNGTGRTLVKSSRMSTTGLTALAEQLGSWRAHSPVKAAATAVTQIVEVNEEVILQAQATPVATEASPISNHFFEDEMSVRPKIDVEAAEQGEEEMNEEEVEDPSFDDIMVTEEDVALASEALEMSLLEPEQLENAMPAQSFDEYMDDTLSDDSQEYGDENDLPVEPAPTSSPARAPVTPVRLVMKTFNTTTKVPLKPSDESTPTVIKKRSFSASRVAPKRPSGLARNATVISYSPMKERNSLAATEEPQPSSAPATPGPVTPTKSDLWSSIGTPARTPRRDLNPALLRGAIVFVDVYTSEGADASGIFVELLTQMGAKCIKNWNWNPSNVANGESSSIKVGITHVVYKDGGKRTLEKVRQANGVVQCVGVSWVLE